MGAGVEAVLTEPGAEQLDLRARGRLLRLADATEQPRPHQADEQPEHDDHHQQLDEGEPALIAADPCARGPPHPSFAKGDPAPRRAPGAARLSEARVVGARSPPRWKTDVTRLMAVLVEQVLACPRRHRWPP